MNQNEFRFLSKWADRLLLLLPYIGCLLIAGYGYVFMNEKGLHPIISMVCSICATAIAATFYYLCTAVTGIAINVVYPGFRDMEIMEEHASEYKPISLDEIKKTAEQIQKKKQVHQALLKEIFHTIIEKYVAVHLHSPQEADKLFENIVQVIDNGSIQKNLVPVKNKDLSREDIFHLGFHLKYYLKKNNDFGASFIYNVFREELKGNATRDSVEYNVVCRKLASKEAATHYIPLPPSYAVEKKRGKNFAVDEDFEKDLMEYKQQ